MNDWKKLKKSKLEAPPLPAETTTNLQNPEVIGEKLDKRTLRKTGRTEQFATRVSKEWLEKVRKIAEKESLKLVEVLEKMLESYEKKLKVSNEFSKKNQHHQPRDKEQESKNPIQPLNRFIKVNFNCDKCYRKFERDTVYSPAPNLDQLNQYPTYCTDCGENEPEFCSFRTETNQEPCPHFVFDKKKQLCRSRNKQV